MIISLIMSTGIRQLFVELKELEKQDAQQDDSTVADSCFAQFSMYLIKKA